MLVNVNQGDEKQVRFRHVIQVFFFILLVLVVGSVCALKIGSLFISCPLGILQSVVATRTFMFSAIIFATVLIIFTFFYGRLFCSWACPVGTLTEHGGRLFPIYTRNLSRGARNLKYWFLAFILISAYFLEYSVFCSICPIGVSCRTVNLRGFLLSPELLVVVLLVFIEAYERRAWCKYFCPVGALLALTSKFKVFKLKIDFEKCISCNKCIRECAKHQMDILDRDNLKLGFIRKDECNACFDCSEVCPKGAIELVRSSDKKHKVFKDNTSD